MSKIWTLEGVRPTLPRQNGFRSAYFIGAVNPKNGDKYALLYDGVDSIVMNHFLANISQKVGENIRIIMVVDGAGWHRSEDLKIPRNIILYYLPPYSPELNPIERIWGFLKENFLSGRCLANMEEIFEYGQQAWRQLNREIIQSICKISYNI